MEGGAKGAPSDLPEDPESESGLPSRLSICQATHSLSGSLQNPCFHLRLWGVARRERLPIRQRTQRASAEPGKIERREGSPRSLSGPSGESEGAPFAPTPINVSKNKDSREVQRERVGTQRARADSLRAFGFARPPTLSLDLSRILVSTCVYGGWREGSAFRFARGPRERARSLAKSKGAKGARARSLGPLANRKALPSRHPP